MQLPEIPVTADVLRGALRSNDAVARDGRLAGAMLSDLMPGQRGVVRALVAAVEHGLPVALRNRSVSTTSVRARCALQMEEDGFDNALIHWAIEVWAAAIAERLDGGPSGDLRAQEKGHNPSEPVTDQAPAVVHPRGTPAPIGTRRRSAGRRHLPGHAESPPARISSSQPGVSRQSQLEPAGNQRQLTPSPRALDIVLDKPVVGFGTVRMGDDGGVVCVRVFNLGSRRAYSLDIESGQGPRFWRVQKMPKRLMASGQGEIAELNFRLDPEVTRQLPVGTHMSTAQIVVHHIRAELRFVVTLTAGSSSARFSSISQLTGCAVAPDLLTERGQPAKLNSLADVDAIAEEGDAADTGDEPPMWQKVLGVAILLLPILFATLAVGLHSWTFFGCSATTLCFWGWAFGMDESARFKTIAFAVVAAMITLLGFLVSR